MVNRLEQLKLSSCTTPVDHRRQLSDVTMAATTEVAPAHHVSVITNWSLVTASIRRRSPSVLDDLRLSCGESTIP